MGKGREKLKFYEIMMLWKLYVFVCTNYIWKHSGKPMLKDSPKLWKSLDKEFQILLNAILPLTKEHLCILLNNFDPMTIPVLSIFAVLALIVLIAHTLFLLSN